MLIILSEKKGSLKDQIIQINVIHNKSVWNCGLGFCYSAKWADT